MDRVEIAGASGTLYLEVDPLPFGQDTPIVAEGVAFGAIDLAGVDWELEDDLLTLADAALTLTADGAEDARTLPETGLTGVLALIAIALLGAGTLMLRLSRQGAF